METQKIFDKRTSARVGLSIGAMFCSIAMISVGWTVPKLFVCKYVAMGFMCLIASTILAAGFKKVAAITLSSVAIYYIYMMCKSSSYSFEIWGNDFIGYRGGFGKFATHELSWYGSAWQLDGQGLVIFFEMLFLLATLVAISVPFLKSLPKVQKWMPITSCGLAFLPFFINYVSSSSEGSFWRSAFGGDLKFGIFFFNMSIVAFFFFIAKGMTIEPVEREIVINNTPKFNVMTGTLGLFKLAILSALTLGIYTYIWIYRTTKLLNKGVSDKRGPGGCVLLALFIPFYKTYWIYRSSKIIEQLDKRDLRAITFSNACTLFSLVSFKIASILLQGKINELSCESEPMNINLFFVKERRYDMFKHILFSLITFGIYRLMWVYSTTKALKYMGDTRSAGVCVVLSLFLPLYSKYWTYKQLCFLTSL